MANIVPNAWRLASKTVLATEQSAGKKVRGKQRNTWYVVPMALSNQWMIEIDEFVKVVQEAEFISEQLFRVVARQLQCRIRMIHVEGQSSHPQIQLDSLALQPSVRFSYDMLSIC